MKYKSFAPPVRRILSRSVLLIAGLIACKDTPTGPAPPSGVRVTMQTKGLDYGSTFNLRIVGEALSLSYSVSPVGTLFYFLKPGSYEVILTGPPSNCTLTQSGRQTIKVEPETVTEVSFAPTCVATSAIILVSVATSGVDLDPTGYSVRFNKAGVLRQSANSSMAFIAPGGQHTVELTDVASNCNLEGAFSRSVSVAVGTMSRDTARIAYNVACQATRKFAFARLADPQASISIAYADGSESITVALGSSPAWSPDGFTVAFESLKCSSDFYYYYYYGPYCVRSGLASVDSRNPVATFRTLTAAADEHPAWRPTGGGVIAFSREGAIYLLAGDGSTRALVAPDAVKGIYASMEPSWSPDGTRLSFTCGTRTGRSSNICVINADGTGLMSLTDVSIVYSQSAWSPDGKTIAFSTDNGEIALIPADGGEVTTLVRGGNPAWSPDGATILFERYGGERGIYSITLDSRVVQRITDGEDRAPAWRP